METFEKPPQSKPVDPLKKRVRREVISWLWVILAFILIEGTGIQARVIPSGSMENTLLVGDHLLVSRLGYDAGIPFTEYHVPLWRNPKRQQIVVFKAPVPGSPDFVKRVVGVPGDRLEIRAGTVYVNGRPLDEPYALRDPGDSGTWADNFPPQNPDMYRSGLQPEWAIQLPKYEQDGQLVVPPDRFFVMGDNRENSFDSRFWGFVPRSSLIGTPIVIYMSIDAPQDAWEPGHIGDRLLAYLRIFIHPGEVRWRRLFTTF